jgi:hypothetical protein
MVGTPPERAYFNVQVPDSLAQYDPLVVVLRGTDGSMIDTLFSGRMDSAAQLSRLAAPHFRGGPVRVEIEGFAGDSAAYREARLFDPATASVQSVQFLSGDSGSPDPVGGSVSGFILSWSDTTISIGDSLRLQVTAQDLSLPTPLWLRWDVEGDGRWDDSLRPKTDVRAWTFGFRHRRVGKYATAVQAVLSSGAVASLRVHVEVLLDPPVADAGRDTTVPLGGVIQLHAGGTDGFGPIVRREWSLNGGAFWSVPWRDTQYPAPEKVGEHIFVLRVTDSDSLTALDTLRVRVVAP